MATENAFEVVEDWRKRRQKADWLG